MQRQHEMEREADKAEEQAILEEASSDRMTILEEIRAMRSEIAALKGLIERHAEETMSRKAADILQHWDTEKGNFLQVCPK